MTKNVFLAAEWRKLLMINYEVPAEIIQAIAPRYTEVDFWEGKTYLSVVGFMFLDTKVMGLKVPFHRNFEEINLRYYVKREEGEEIKRGVGFVREIVPKAAITEVANLWYKEHYATFPMRHQIEEKPENLAVEYAWKQAGKWQRLAANSRQKKQDLAEGSHEAFIAEHYWGYSEARKGTVEYQVTHPSWQYYPVEDFELDIDFELAYGKTYARFLQGKPASVFIAEGSEVQVLQPNLLRFA